MLSVDSHCKLIGIRRKIKNALLCKAPAGIGVVFGETPHTTHTTQIYSFFEKITCSRRVTLTPGAGKLMSLQISLALEPKEGSFCQHLGPFAKTLPEWPISIERAACANAPKYES